jgi:UbiD family decarboxylase
MNPSMHTYIEHLERDMPAHVVRVTREVSPEFEIPAILQLLEAKKKHAVLIFEKVPDLDGGVSKLPVVINLFGSRERLADALGTSVARLPLEYLAREKPVPPVIIDKTQAAVKEIVEIGEAADLHKFPL